MPRREISQVEKEILINIARATRARDSDAMKAAFAQFNELCGNSRILGQDECPYELYCAESAFVRCGLYMGSDNVPDVINFDNVSIGGAAAAPQEGSIALYENPSDAVVQSLGEN